MACTSAVRALRLRSPRCVIFLVPAIGLYLASARYSALNVAGTFAGLAVAAAVVLVIFGVTRRAPVAQPASGRHAAGLAARGGAGLVSGFGPDPVRRRERGRRMADPERLPDATGQMLWHDGLSALVDLAGATGSPSIVPANVPPSDRDALEAVGFEFGPLTDDPLFQQATLPRGWRMDLNWRSRRIEVLDGQEVVRAVIRYRPSFTDRRRWAGMTLVLHDEDTVGGSPAPDWFTRTPADLELAGLRAIADPRIGVWALAPHSPTTDEVLIRLDFRLGPLLEGDNLFRRVLPPLGWHFVLDPTARAVEIVDADGCTRLMIMYSKTAAGRWAAAMEIEPPSTHVNHAVAA